MMSRYFSIQGIELIENEQGGEGAAIKRFRSRSRVKSLKKVANASYGDIRHAPKPGDVIRPWSDQDLKACFEACEKIVLVYFNSLFP